MYTIKVYILLLSLLVFLTFCSEHTLELAQDKANVERVEIVEIIDGETTVLMEVDDEVLDKIEALECAPIYPPEQFSGGIVFKVIYNDGEFQLISQDSVVYYRADGKVSGDNCAFVTSEFESLMNSYLGKIGRVYKN